VSSGHASLYYTVATHLAASPSSGPACLYYIVATHLAASPSSGPACLYYIVANHLAAAPACGHALLQVAVYLQHSTLPIDWLGLPEIDSGHTTYLYAAAPVPAATRPLLPCVQAPWQLVLAPVCLLRLCCIIWCTSAGLLCIQCLKSQQPVKGQEPCILSPEHTYLLLLLQACCHH
jgi:hypothetical protein